MGEHVLMHRWQKKSLRLLPEHLNLERNPWSFQKVLVFSPNSVIE